MDLTSATCSAAGNGITIASGGNSTNFVKSIAEAGFAMRIPSHRRGERGQTIALVAVSIVSLLAMAALAIDVVSLYVAKSEVQRAADAAALAGAQAVANSGVTTLAPTDANLGNAETLATSMANAAITAIVGASPSVNLVAGSAPALVGSPTISFTPNNNPTVTVTLQQTNLPTFFSKIWGSRLISTSATATAEAYNPANSTGATYTSIAPRCVKPWLVANQDPGALPGVANFVNVTTGAVTQTDLVGEGFFLRSDCPLSAGCSTLGDTPPKALRQGGNNFLEYVPTNVTYPGRPAPIMYPSCAVGEPDVTYTEAIEGCDPNPYACGGPTNGPGPGGSCTSPLNCWDPSINPGFAPGGNQNSDSAVGAQCLIHSTAMGLPPTGQDTLSWPSAFPSGPPEIRAGSGPQSGNPVTTSPSIVTIPIIDTNNFSNLPPDPVTVVGFLQAFIDYVNVPTGPPLFYDIHVTILNVAGCGTNSAGNPVVGGFGTSPVPVRLITPP